VPGIVSSPKYKIKQDCPYRCAILAHLHLENTSRRLQSTLCKKTLKIYWKPRQKKIAKKTAKKNRQGKTLKKILIMLVKQDQNVEE